MFNGMQVRMARAALGWAVRDLGDLANVNPNTISRFENGKGARSTTLEKIERALRDAGARFVNDDDGESGVMFYDNE